MGAKSAYVVNGLSEDQVKLGRLVTNVFIPFDKYHDPPTLSLAHTTNTSKLTQHSSTLYNHSNSQTSIFLRLSKLFGIDHDRRSKTFWKVEAESVTTQMLSNYSEVFETLWKCVASEPREPDRPGKPKSELARTREWIQNRLEDDEHVYMVVGIKTVTNAKVTVGQSSGVTNIVDAGIPVTEIVSHGLSTPVDMSALDAMIAVTVGQRGGAGETYEVKEPFVMAVQYCRVKLKKRKIGNGNSEETLTPRDISWEWFIGGRPRVMTPSTRPKDEFTVSVSLGNIVDMADIVMGEEEPADADGEADDDHIQNVLIGDVELMF
jgi:hypothetical protein